MWNLLSIVREMYRRCDRNAIRLLEIITEECMACDQVTILNCIILEYFLKQLHFFVDSSLVVQY